LTQVTSKTGLSGILDDAGTPDAMLEKSSHAIHKSKMAPLTLPIGQVGESL